MTSHGNTGFDLSGRRALITGGDRGIGAGIALGLADHGADIALHYSGPSDGAETTAAAIRGMGRNCTLHQADFDRPENATALIETVTRDAPLDILISNVAIQIMRPWDAIPLDEADRHWRINYLSTLAMIQGAVPPMQAAGRGRVILIGSVQQADPHPEMLVYASLKSALENAARNLAKQTAAHGVTVNTVAPGVIATDRTKSAIDDPVHRQSILDQIPAGRIGAPGDISGACVFLASDCARYVTGQTLYVDGGLTL